MITVTVSTRSYPQTSHSSVCPAWQSLTNMKYLDIIEGRKIQIRFSLFFAAHSTPEVPTYFVPIPVLYTAPAAVFANGVRSRSRRKRNDPNQGISTKVRQMSPSSDSGAS